MNMNTIKLKSPIDLAGAKIEQLDFEPMKAKHIVDMSAEPGMKDMMAVAAKLCGQSKTVIGELAMEDLSVVLDYVGKQFAPFQEIGKS
jgi:hypothetical protein